MSAAPATAPVTSNAKHAACDFNTFLAQVQAVQAIREQRLLSAAQFAKMAKEPKTIVLDARGESDFVVLHVQGAVNLPYTSMGYKSLAELIPDRETRILIYCRNNLGDKWVQGLIPYIAKSPAGGLNIPTFITLYGYGYQNVYELDEIVDPNDSPIEFVKK